MIPQEKRITNMYEYTNINFKTHTRVIPHLMRDPDMGFSRFLVKPGMTVIMYYKTPSSYVRTRS
jgi:hypothetical protein